VESGRRHSAQTEEERLRDAAGRLAESPLGEGARDWEREGGLEAGGGERVRAREREGGRAGAGTGDGIVVVLVVGHGD
jgi:hypothetical protein